MIPHLAGLPVILSRVAESVLLIGRDTMVMPQHSVAAEAAITAELVACTLGQRHRPELLPREPFVRGEGIEPPTRGV